MNFLWQIDWAQLFVPEMSVLEIFVRGTLIYLGLCLLLRVVLKRQTGKVSLSDLLVVAIIAGVCRNPLVKDAHSLTDGALVVTVVLFWSYTVNWLSYHIPLMHKLFHSPPVPLIRDGHVLKEQLQSELMTEAQLRSKLRRKGVKEPTEVAEAWMEGDGQISVIKKQEFPPGQIQRRPLYPVNEHRPETDDSPAPDGDRNGVPAGADAPTVDEVRTFLDAGRKLQDKIALHEQAITQHQQEIAEIQEALERFGCHERRTGQTRRNRKAPGLAGEGNAHTPPAQRGREN